MPAKIHIQLNHYQFIFLMRLADRLTVTMKGFYFLCILPSPHLFSCTSFLWTVVNHHLPHSGISFTPSLVYILSISFSAAPSRTSFFLPHSLIFSVALYDYLHIYHSRHCRYWSRHWKAANGNADKYSIPTKYNFTWNRRRHRQFRLR